jgi:hypothetical protein
MKDSLRRREILQVGAVAGLGSFVGCSGLNEDPVYTSITLNSFSNSNLNTDITIHSWEDDSSDIIFRENLELEQQEDRVDHVFEDAFETQRAIVDIDADKQAGNPDIKKQFTYFPGCTTEKAREIGHALLIELDPEADHLGIKVDYDATCGNSD